MRIVTSPRLPGTSTITGNSAALLPNLGMGHVLEGAQVNESDGFRIDAACAIQPGRLDQRLFLSFVHELAALGRRSRATPAALTGAVLQVWFRRSFPKLRSAALAAPATLVTCPSVQSFAAALSQQPLLDGAYWLSSAYAKLLRGEQRRALSMYFTPPLLAMRVLDDLAAQGVKFDSEHFLDPACGGAAFLVPIAIRMRQELQRRVSPTELIAHVQSHIHGMDLDPALCVLSRELLRAVLYEEISYCGIEPIFSIRTGNSLIDAKDLYRTANVVVCNPPYRKMSAKEVNMARPEFGHVLSAQPNLYGLFIALSVQFLRQDGVGAVVTPTSYLSGHSFSTLRTYLLRMGHITSIGIVGEKEGVFMDVEQETAVTTFKLGAQKQTRARTSVSLISTKGEIALIGDCTLTDSGAAWPIPRSASDVPLIEYSSRMKHRLQDYGYEARVGNYVWNRDQRTAYSSENFARRYNNKAVPLLWSSDIKPGKTVHFDGIKKRNGERRFVVVKDPVLPPVIREPCVLLQRVTSNEQPRRLVAAAVSRAFFLEYGGFIGENHTITLVPSQSRPALTPSQLAELLGCSQVDRLFRCISGATNVSIFELGQLPLPDPGALKRRLTQGLSMQEAVTDLCGNGQGSRCGT